MPSTIERDTTTADPQALRLRLHVLHLPGGWFADIDDENDRQCDDPYWARADAERAGLCVQARPDQPGGIAQRRRHPMKIHTPLAHRQPVRRCTWCNEDPSDHAAGEFEEHQILLEANTDEPLASRRSPVSASRPADGTRVRPTVIRGIGRRASRKSIADHGTTR